MHFRALAPHISKTFRFDETGIDDAAKCATALDGFVLLGIANEDETRSAFVRYGDELGKLFR